jgi:phosphoribosylanthranilate isomerase
MTTDRVDAFRAGVQVAGVHDLAEAQLILGAGATALGFPLRLPEPREDLTEEAAAAVIAACPPVPRVLITYQGDPEAVGAFADALGVDWVQLHGAVTVGQVEALRRLRPALGLLKALVVAGSDPAPVLAEAEAFAPLVDAFITDTFDPRTGQRGATGRTHPWAVSRAVVEARLAPVILAGGLDPTNVAEAIAAVRPWAVDAHTSLEGPDGRKTTPLVEAFSTNASEAFRRHPPAR